MKSTFNCSTIHSIVTCVPEKTILLEDQVDLLYGGDIKKVQRIKKAIGLHARHIADKNTTTLDLCFQSCMHLFEANHISPEEIDGLVFVTQTPNFLQPNNAHLLHNKLKLSQNCACFDLNQGCSGYVYGLFLASTLIQSGAHNILLCAGDTLSKVVDDKDSNTTPLFGDAGSATLLTRANQTSFFALYADGRGWENIVLPNSGFAHPSSLKKTPQTANTLCMDGAEVFNFSIEKEPAAIRDILHYAQKNIKEIDYIFFHQANAYIISNIIRRLDLPADKAPCSSIAKYGNTSSASIPLALCDFFHSQERKNELDLIFSGFGVGLSWATCLTTLANNAIILKPEIYQGDNQ